MHCCPIFATIRSPWPGRRKWWALWPQEKIKINAKEHKKRALWAQQDYRRNEKRLITYHHAIHVARSQWRHFTNKYMERKIFLLLFKQEKEWFFCSDMQTQHILTRIYLLSKWLWTNTCYSLLLMQTCHFLAKTLTKLIDLANSYIQNINLQKRSCNFQSSQELNSTVKFSLYHGTMFLSASQLLNLNHNFRISEFIIELNFSRSPTYTLH